MDFFCKAKGVHPDDMAAFSAMDDRKGYNVSPTEPSSDYITDLFKTLAAEYKDQLEGAFDDQPPCSVISLDHTFNNAKRTCEYNPAKEPENLPAGARGHSSYAAIETNALLIAIGADGKVSGQYRSVCCSISRMYALLIVLCNY
jgi:hypothetical protein